MLKRNMKKETQEKLEKIDKHLGIHLGHYLYTFVAVMFIVIGIKSLQYKHCIDESYQQYAGWYYILFGIIIILLMNHLFKRKSKK